MKLFVVAASLLVSQCCLAAAVIPIEIENGNPVASVVINGKSVRLVVDSGGGVLTLKSEAISTLALTKTGSTRSTTDSLGNTTSRTLFHVDSLELGALKFQNLDADEASEYASQSPVDGMIGRNILNRYAVVYDYPARRITLVSPDNKSELRAECRGTQIELTPSNEGLVITPAQIDQGEIRILWDTGAVYSFVKKSFADQYKLPIETPYYTSQQFTLAKENFGPVRFVVLDLRAPAEADGYLGSNFFLENVVCIDPAHHAVRVRKRA